MKAKNGKIMALTKFWIETHQLKSNFLSFQKIIKIINVGLWINSILKK